MKNKLFILLLAILELIMMTGCTPSNDYIAPSEDSTMEKPLSSCVDIYQMDRDTFDAFINNPTSEILTTSPKKIYSGGDNQRYLRQRVIPFTITEDFITFAGDPASVQEFLLQNGINCSVTRVLILDAPNVPLTIWAGEGFITVNEQPEDEAYTYRCYTQSAFKEKFNCVTGSLIVNGYIISLSTPPKIYEGYADVPLIAVLEAFGATIQEEYENVFAITYQGKNYYLNTSLPKLYEIGKEELNLLYLTAGGPTFVYKQEQELMVDTATLTCVLWEMGQAISVSCDRTNSTVIITPK